MDDAKKTYRDIEQDTKQARRDADGWQSPADVAGNVGDEVRKDLGNAGDDITGGAGDATVASKEAWRRSDGDESVADKVGNAGDEIRRDVTGRP
jgi:hypothetical protein